MKCTETQIGQATASLLVLLLCTCSRARNTAPASAPAQLVQAESPVPECAGDDGISLADTPSRIDLVCRDEFRDCSGRFELRVRNCTRQTWTLQRYRVPSALIGQDLAPPVRLLPGQSSKHLLRGPSRTGRYDLQVELRSDAGDVRFMSHTLSIGNPAYDAAVGACKRCNGEWGRHGMAGIEGCRCRTSDAGKSCDDGRDCEGLCISGEEGDGFRCSEFYSIFGCYSYLPEGWSSGAQQPARIVPQVCSD